MRVEAKDKKPKSKSFWTSCEDLWHAVVDDKPTDAMSEKLEIEAHKLGVRENVAHQLRSMAKLFGLSPQVLQRTEGRTQRFMRKCDDCKMSEHCFVTKRGRPDTVPHISPQSCPNFGEYQQIARDLGSRTAIKNKLV